MPKKVARIKSIQQTSPEGDHTFHIPDFKRDKIWKISMKRPRVLGMNNLQSSKFAKVSTQSSSARLGMLGPSRYEGQVGLWPSDSCGTEVADVQVRKPAPGHGRSLRDIWGGTSTC